MNTLRLPSVEETRFNLSDGTKTVEVDLLDIDIMHSDAVADKDKYEPDGQSYPFFQKRIRAKYGLEISLYGAYMLLSEKNKLKERLGNECWMSSDQESSTASPQETTESSSSTN